MSTTADFNPADNLLNLKLDGGWEVFERLPKKPDDTGGNFSICYKVRRNGDVAFLKALDLSLALASETMLEDLQFLTAAHLYEVELLVRCANRKMDKVVLVLENGKVTPKVNNPINLTVHYLIFEIADKTIREHVLNQKFDLDNSCLMRSIHNVALAISQLHGAGIAHQDIKPSNILLYDEKGNSKVSDLGRAESKHKQSQIFDEPIAGDPTYAPPELLYSHVSPDWDIRRKATDLYHLGSLITFYYTRDHMTSLLFTFLPRELAPNRISAEYGVVLPYLKVAFGESLGYLEGQLEDAFSDERITKDIVNVISFLCDPDPAQRGHPENRMIPSTRYSMERFIAIFDRLARRFEAKSL
jgi:serine/threonine protein kinase